MKGETMRKLIITALFTAFIAVLVSPAAWAQSEKTDSAVKEVKKETRELLNALKNYTAKQREEAVKHAEKAMDKMDRKIETLEDRIDSRWDKMDSEAREKARTALKKLREQRNTLSEWYGSFKNSSENAWDQMKNGFSEAYRTLSQSWEKAMDKFDEDK
jgi:peptidoglycan hydrolase CwlO-like protein